MEEEKWLVPDYFSSFSCKCGECRNACCKGWKIAVTREEYFRLIGMECSEELHSKLESAFYEPEIPTTERFRCIEPDWRGQCRMLGDDGLCMLQKECGEEAIPETCRVYPRSYKKVNGRLQVVCSASCEAVAEMLMTEERITFGMKPLKNHIKAEIEETLSEDFEVLAEKSREIICDKSVSLYDRILKVGDLLGTEHASGIELKALLQVLHELLETSDTLKPYVSEAFERYAGADEESVHIYNEDFKLFTEHYPDWEVWLENLLINNMVYSFFPYCDKRIGSPDAFWGLLLQYQILKLVCTVYTRENPTAENFADCVAAVYHLVEHTSFYYNSGILVNNLNNFVLTNER